MPAGALVWTTLKFVTLESDCCGLLTVYPVLLLPVICTFALPFMISPTEKVAIEPVDEVATM